MEGWAATPLLLARCLSLVCVFASGVGMHRVICGVSLCRLAGGGWIVTPATLIAVPWTCADRCSMALCGLESDNLFCHGMVLFSFALPRWSAVP